MKPRLCRFRPERRWRERVTMSNKFPGQSRGGSLVIGGLVVSVILNLFFIGVFAGVIPHVREGKHLALLALSSPYNAMKSKALTRSLTPADAAVFGDEMQ